MGCHCHRWRREAAPGWLLFLSACHGRSGSIEPGKCSDGMTLINMDNLRHVTPGGCSCTGDTGSALLCTDRSCSLLGRRDKQDTQDRVGVERKTMGRGEVACLLLLVQKSFQVWAGQWTGPAPPPQLRPGCCWWRLTQQIKHGSLNEGRGHSAAAKENLQSSQ